MSEGLCTEHVNRGGYRASNFQDCGRVAIKDGLCALHVRVRDNRAKKHADWQAKNDRGKALVAEAEQLGQRLGIRVTADYNAFLGGGGGYTGRFTVPSDWLRTMADLDC